jgi:leucyl-tRNA synthetase
LNSLYLFRPSSDSDKKIFRESFESLVLLSAPFIPHMAEELWSRLGHSGTVFREKWPAYEASALKREEEEIVIQISGRVRSRVKVRTDISEEELKNLALQDTKVREWVDGKPVRKIVVIPHRLVNLVV